MSSKYDETNAALTVALTKCAHGEKQAFSIIYELTSPKFSAIIMGMVKCEETTRDILQRAYTSIWLNAHKYDACKAKAFTWMLVIMRNRALDVLRERKRSRDFNELDETIEDIDSPKPHQRASINQAREVLNTHLAVLPKHISRAVVLHIAEGYTCQEIGAQMGTSPNTVKSWIRRGLERLRRDIPIVSFDAAL